MKIDLRKRLVKRWHGEYGARPRAFDAWQELRPQLGTDDKESNEVLIYGLIVPESERACAEEFFGDTTPMSGARFRQLLGEIDGDVVLRINSDGGDVFEASAIINAIQERSQTDAVSATIDGIAASAASIIAAACDTVSIAEMGMVMIHRAGAMMYGNAADLRKAAEVLEKVDMQAVKFYARRMTGLDDQAILALMDDETYFTAEEAIDNGFADSLTVSAREGSQVTAADMQQLRELNMMGSLVAAL